MSLVNGIDVTLSTNAFEPKLLGCARAINFELQRDMLETSIVGSGNFRTFIPGASSFTGSIEGLVFLNDNGYGDILALPGLYQNFLDGTELNLKYYEQDKDNTHYLQKECTVYIESITESASFDNITTFSATFKGTGQPTITYDTL